MKTLTEARHNLNSELQQGVKCPCCGQHAQMYKRKITSSMAYALILFSKRDDPGCVHIEDYFKELNCPSSIRGDFPKLRFWGLIQRKPESLTDGNPSSGYYRITELGWHFLYKNHKVSKYLWIYNNKVKAIYKEDGKELRVDIEECLGSKFNYNELVNHQTTFDFINK